MLNVQKMIASAQEALGWPYVSPGSNNAAGIDCSGLFVKIYKDQGASIYHGSNKIYRKYCNEKGKITSIAKLKPGMAVFKWKDRQPSGYKDSLGDFHHIGLVVSGNPLKIIHASSAKGQVVEDTKLGQWLYYGKLNDVAYENGDDNMPTYDIDNMNDASVKEMLAVVTADSGSTVKMRAKPSTSSSIYWDIPVGATVVVDEKGDPWSRIRHGSRSGYMMTKFLKIQEGEETDKPADEPAVEKITVEKPRLEEAHTALDTALKAFIVPKSTVEKAYDIIGDMLGLRG